MRPLPTSIELRRTERYVVHEAIAMGGQASVHLGVLEGALGFARIVAIKRLLPQLAADTRFVAMLIEEARLLSRIRHVNVVTTLDILDDGGEVFVILEYVRGASLDRLREAAALRDELVPTAFLAAIVAGALRGLHAAHEASDADGVPLGIVHRDVSPQNILVGTAGIARIIDFGLARGSAGTGHSRTGEFMGKLAYAAPEQVTGGAPTRRTDVFSAGVVLWELLTGHRLFKGETDGETLHNILNKRVVPPEELAEDARVRERRSREELERVGAIAVRALTRDPRGRFASAEEMATALEACVPLAPAAAIGAWVEKLAASQLELERSVIAKIELAGAGRASLRTAVPAPDVRAPPAADATQVEGRRRRGAMAAHAGLPVRVAAGLMFAAAAGAALAGGAVATAVARGAPPIRPAQATEDAGAAAARSEPPGP